jgi:hypothetical protein
MGAVPVIVRTTPYKLGAESDPSRQIAASVEPGIEHCHSNTGAIECARGPSPDLVGTDGARAAGYTSCFFPDETWCCPGGGRGHSNPAMSQSGLSSARSAAI